MKSDIVFIHPPSVYDFREKPLMFGPVSDMVPSTPVFEMYPIGFVVLSDYLERRGFKTRIVNLAVKMIKDPKLNIESVIKSLDTRLFALDLHWLTHAQGAVEVARIIKRIHPSIPVIFGGLSATYYHSELIEYPHIDMVMKGDSTEEPMRILLEVLKKGGKLVEVPNLTWKDSEGSIVDNPISFVPEAWNHSRINYGQIIKSIIRDRDLRAYLPFHDFLRYPIVASLVCRGCIYNCGYCGGSKYSYAKFFNRPKAAFRDPEDLAFDIADAARFVNGPIFILNDIQAGGPDYVDMFLRQLAKYKIKNKVAFEFWKPPAKETFEQISGAVKDWSFEISCESQSEEIRRKNGKGGYSNGALRQSVADGLNAGAERADVYLFMGIPFQTKQSILEMPDFAEYLYDGLKGNARKLVCMAAPLAPFIDPGSLAFEKPELYDLTIKRRSLKEHIKAMDGPSWKYWLNYESHHVDHDSFVDATYDCGLMLNEVKMQRKCIGRDDAEAVRKNIEKAKEIMRKIDIVYSSRLPDAGKNAAYLDLRGEMTRYSMSTVCKKNELEWNVPAVLKFKASGLIKALLTA